MDNQTRQFIGGVAGLVVGIALKFTVFADETDFYWWLMPIMFIGLGMRLAKVDK